MKRSGKIGEPGKLWRLANVLFALFFLSVFRREDLGEVVHVRTVGCPSDRLRAVGGDVIHGACLQVFPELSAVSLL